MHCVDFILVAKGGQIGLQKKRKDHISRAGDKLRGWWCKGEVYLESLSVDEVVLNRESWNFTVQIGFSFIHTKPR